MIRLAVTGGIACGKSTVGAMLEGKGLPVCEADVLAHEAIRPGGAAYDAVVNAFGSEILEPGGAVDRGCLARRVFADRAERETLNSLVHPVVRRAWEAWLTDRPAGTRAAAVIIPLFFEIREAAGWDRVIAVIASERQQFRRLASRGFSEAEARARMAAQMPLTEKARRADFVIVNEGSEDILARQTQRVLESILENSAHGE
jgi:dephospho-CoA kinase